MEKILCFINHVINLIYPNVCGICDKICENNICKKCEISLNNIIKTKINKYNDKNFTKHLYIFKYEGIIKDKLIQYKFNDKSYIHKAFVKILIKDKKVCRFLKNYDIIIPVPIHYKRKILRGYNQSALIAKSIAQKCNINYLENVLIKRTNNKPQSTIGKEERQKNVIGMYYINNKYKIYNKKILLFDDIYTTGSTVNECAKMLKQAGARFIDVLTIAKD